MNLFKSVILDRFQSFRKSWSDIIGRFWRKFKSSFSFSSSNNFSTIDCFIDRTECLFLTRLLKKKFYRARIWSFFCLVRRNKNRMARRKSTRWKFNLSHALKNGFFQKSSEISKIFGNFWPCRLTGSGDSGPVLRLWSVFDENWRAFEPIRGANIVL